MLTACLREYQRAGGPPQKLDSCSGRSMLRMAVTAGHPAAHPFLTFSARRPVPLAGSGRAFLAPPMLGVHPAQGAGGGWSRCAISGAKPSR
jgi:hypothetical protein